MKRNGNACPPLTPNDVIILRGEPMAKKIESVHNSHNEEIEEWTYYNTQTNIKEFYVFKDGQLIDYKHK